MVNPDADVFGIPDYCGIYHALDLIANNMCI